MNLWYITIRLDRASFERAYLSDFGYRTRFISNFLSRQIRKSKFVTDGTFKMIGVTATNNTANECAIVPDCVLETQILFDQTRYEQIKGSKDCGYYLEMFEEGFRKASGFKKIPLEDLLGLLDEFRKGGCKNEWLHKRKRFKEYDIEVALNCYFTTLDFKLVATVKRISTKEELCSGVILETLPDEIFFDKEFKDILIDEEYIIITNFLDEPNILIDLKKALNKELSFEQLPDEEDDDD